jgi:beta-xylosidase
MSTVSSQAFGEYQPAWRDRSRPAAERVDDLLARLTPAEKLGQLAGVWVGVSDDGDSVAPHQHELAQVPPDWPSLLRTGLGQFTRPFGTAPVDPALGARALARVQSELVAANRFGIPAMAHEECLTGFTAWGATIYPTPLAWGATFDPDAVHRMASRIGADLRAVGVHQGLAPVLDVARDARWGRTEETMGADPYLVADLGTAYVRGLQSSGLVATLKHFVGYSASRDARNMGAVSIGWRELVDVLLPPFEAAVLEGGARSVMHAYTAIDGVPSAADERLLTTLLRDRWGFGGTVVADYFGVSFLQTLYGLAPDPAAAAGLALAAGVDVELPTVRCYGEPLAGAVERGDVPQALVDRAVRRVLLQKCELGLLDEDWSPTPAALSRLTGPGDGDVEGRVDLDPPENRALARELAEKSVVLLSNTGVLPLRARSRIAVVGPNADDPMAMMGCYAFPAHVGPPHPGAGLGVEIPTVLAALRAELPGIEIGYARGCSVAGAEREGFDAAVSLAASAEVCVAVLGDRAGMFGRGTSGEGCDAEDLALPGVQEAFLAALLATGTPVVLVLLTGRPYALGAVADRLGAAVQAFFPGEEGGPALAGVLSGRVNPSGRLPIEVPRRPAGATPTYLATALGQANEGSSVDPTPLFPFGHGLSYTGFAWRDEAVDAATIGTDGSVTVSLTVANTGDRAGADVVQLYLHDPVAQVTRPLMRLIGYARVDLVPGEARRVSFAVHADLTSFAGRDGERIVEPGVVELRLARSSADVVAALPVRLTGEVRATGVHRARFARTHQHPET